jgi:hypothetical protein
MRIGTFEPGTEVLLEGQRYRIHKVVGVEGILLIDERSGSLRTANSQALDFINPGSAVSRGRGIELADVPEEQWAEAKRRRGLVAPLAERSLCPVHFAEEVAGEPGVGIRDPLRHGVDPERIPARHFPDRLLGMQILEHGPAGPVRHPKGDGGLGGRQGGNGHEAVDQKRQPGGGAPSAGALEKTAVGAHEVGVKAQSPLG